MSGKQREHNRGQQDGAKADGFDEFVVMNNPVESPEYKRGFQHGRQQQVEAKAQETVKAPIPMPYIGSGSLGGGIAGKGILIVLFLIVGIPAGLLIQWHKKREYIAELGTARMSIRVGGQDADGSGAIRYAHGRPQTLRIFIDWDNQAVYWSERPIQVALSRDGKVLYNHLWRHDELVQFNALAFDITDTFPIGRYLIWASVEGAPPARHSFAVEPRPPGNIFISDTPREWPRQDITTLQHRPGEHKKIFAYIQINGTMPEEGRIVYISLMHEGATLFNYSNRVTEQNRNFYIPYEADFSEGMYTARLSADGEPPAEYAFKVQYPIVESAEEKNRRIAAFMDSILPGGHRQEQASPVIPQSGNTTTQPAIPSTPTTAPRSSWVNLPPACLLRPGASTNRRVLFVPMTAFVSMRKR